MYLSEHMPVPDVEKIAVVRANALGDFLFALPALEALRATYPHAEIVLLAKSWHAAFLKGRPSPVDRVVVVPPCVGVGAEEGAQEDPVALEHFFSDMVREHFDLALQLHGGGRYSNPFTLRLGAHLTVGLRTPDAAPLDRCLPYVYFQQEVMRYLETVSLVGAAPVVLEPRIAVTQADLVEAQRQVPESDKPLIALHPGASDPGRRWPAEKFAELGDALAAKGAHVLITGVEDERSTVEAVSSAMRCYPQNLCGHLSLGGLTGLLSRCHLVVSNDTGPLHLAAAVGVPTIGLFWGFNMLTGGHLLRAHHRPIISWQLYCSVCGIDLTRSRCQHDISYVSDIGVEEVIDAAHQLLCCK